MDKVATVEAREIEIITEKAKTALASILPKETTLEQAKAIIWAGQELGLQPFQALRSMAFINGRLTMSVQLQLALARRAGVLIEKIVETPESCQVTLRRGEQTVQTIFTMDDARRAGLVRPGGSWEKYPREMLRWRAIGAALRLIAADVVMGLLSPEEAENLEPVEVTVEPEVMEKKVEEEVEKKVEEGKQDVNGKGSNGNGKLEGMVTAAQLKAIHNLIAKLKIENKHEVISRIVGREISTTRDLTKAEAAAVISELVKQL